MEKQQKMKKKKAVIANSLYEIRAFSSLKTVANKFSFGWSLIIEERVTSVGAFTVKLVYFNTNLFSFVGEKWN